MSNLDLTVETLDIRRVRREAISRRQASARRKQLMRGLVVGLAVIATFMMAVAIGVAATT
ncbi:hypothetical protein L6R53_04655 [Myxococcota bacterium]|nr:hypothetical protein [Myxococcota bacterium]